MSEVTLTIKNNNELNSSELITIMQARVKVFVVEQNCAYQEVDDEDFNARHVYLTNGHDLVAYTRIISDDDSNYIRFGRVLVAKPYRHQQFGRQIVAETIKEIRQLYPEKDIKIGAQNYLRNFYESFGFQAVSDVYLEDDIPHIDMILSEDH